ncbi:MAG: hypothetical protein ACOVRG_09970, partial [Saprospiraceae bacterium]
ISTLLIDTLIIYGSPPPHPPPQEMERVFLGVFYVVHGCILWLFSRDTGRALCGTPAGEKIYGRPGV